MAFDHIVLLPKVPSLAELERYAQTLWPEGGWKVSPMGIEHDDGKRSVFAIPTPFSALLPALEGSHALFQDRIVPDVVGHKAHLIVRIQGDDRPTSPALAHRASAAARLLGAGALCTLNLGVTTLRFDAETRLPPSMVPLGAIVLEKTAAPLELGGGMSVRTTNLSQFGAPDMAWVFEKGTSSGGDLETFIQVVAYYASSPAVFHKGDTMGPENQAVRRVGLIGSDGTVWLVAP